MAIEKDAEKILEEFSKTLDKVPELEGTYYITDNLNLNREDESEQTDSAKICNKLKGEYIMRMNLILEILDVPGQLVSILNPIGELGANVVTIVHKREIKAEEGKAAIQIAIEGERENLQAVIDRFKEMNIALIEVDDTVRKEKLSAILYGHIIDRDLRDTVDKINAVDGLVVSDLQLKLDGELKSTALITVELDLGKRDIAYNKIMEIAEEKDFLVIDEV